MLQYPTLSLKPSSFPFQQSSANRNMSVRAEVAHMAAPVADGKSLYEVLRVKQNASLVEIKTAYRTLAKLHHPDARARFMNSAIASSPDGRDFMEIHKAYATLSDPDARAEYDLNMSVDSRRLWDSVGISGGYRSPGRGRFYQTRRWETDQCW